MKKQLLLAVVFIATTFGMSAQTVVFDSYIPEGEAEFSIVATSTNGIFTFVASESRNFLITINAAYFNDETNYTTRLQSRGTTHAEGRSIEVACPSDGTLKIYARTGSNSATDRTVVVTQNGAELYNQVVQEGEAGGVIIEDNGEDGTRNIYPVISIPVGEGTATITFPVGSINIYSLSYVVGSTSNINESNINVVASEYYNISGVKMNETQPGLNIVKNYYEDGSVKVNKVYIK